MPTHSLLLKNQEEIFEYYVTTTGMEPGCMQLSAGPLDLKIEHVELAGVTLIWASSEGASRWHDECPGDGGIMFGFAVSAEAPILVLGREVDQYTGLCWVPGQDVDYLFRGPSESLTIHIDGELVNQLGWNLRGEPVKRLLEDQRDLLLRLCELASNWMAIRQSSKEASAYTQGVIRWRDTILDAIEPVLARWTAQQDTQPAFLATKNFEIMRAAEACFNSNDQSTRLEIGEIAEQLGLHRRTLFHAFREVVGHGPRRFFELKRLCELRQNLLNANCDMHTVGSIAQDLGFFETGRLASIYKKQFGELPSQTLKRS